MDDSTAMADDMADRGAHALAAPAPGAGAGHRSRGRRKPSTHAQTRKPSFRFRLRADTAAGHHAAEAAFAPFHADPMGRMGWFLAAQSAALAALTAARDGAPTPQEARLAPALGQALAADCAELGVRPAQAEGPARPLDPLAVAYLLLGARLGAEVMRRDLPAEAADRPPRFFSLHVPPSGLPSDPSSAPPSAPASSAAPSDWATLCAALDALDPDGPRARRILADVAAGYDIYLRAAAAPHALSGIEPSA